MVAAALQAGTLILLTAVPGLMRTFPDESTLIHNLSQQKLEEALTFAEGRMKKKNPGFAGSPTRGRGARDHRGWDAWKLLFPMLWMEKEQ